MVDAPVVLPLLSFTLLWGLVGLILAWLLPALLDACKSLAPSLRSLTLLVAALYPLAIAAALTLSLYLPALTEWTVDFHCHDGRCGAHVPMLQASLGLWRSTRITRLMALLADDPGGQEYRLIESERLLACCVGILRPSVIVSSALKALVDARQFAVVLAHEHAHRHRMDNLRQLVAGLATLPWPAGARRALLRDLRLAAELSCDEAVASALGDRAYVAQCIEQLESAQLSHGRRDDHFATSRVSALRQPRRPASRRGLLLLAFGACTGIPLLVLTHPLHRLFEALAALL
jgi:Zn-dependent protease with chaperone function